MKQYKFTRPFIRCCRDSARRGPRHGSSFRQHATRRIDKRPHEFVPPHRRHMSSRLGVAIATIWVAKSLFAQAAVEPIESAVEPICAVASSDASIVVTASTGGHLFVRRNGQIATIDSALSGPIKGMQFTTASELVVHDVEEIIRVDLESSKVVDRRRAPPSSAMIALAPSGRAIAVVTMNDGRTTLCCLDYVGSQPLVVRSRIDVKDGIRDMAWTGPDVLVTTSRDRHHVCFRSIDTPERRFTFPDENIVAAGLIDRDKAWLVTEAKTSRSQVVTLIRHLTSSRSRERSNTNPAPKIERTTRIPRFTARRVFAARDGRRLVIGGLVDGVRHHVVYDRATGRTKTLRFPELEIRDVLAVTRDADRAIVTDRQHRTYIAPIDDEGKPERPREVPADHSWRVIRRFDVSVPTTCLALTDTRVAIGSIEGRLGHLYDLTDGRLVQEWHQSMADVAFSSTGSRILWSTDHHALRLMSAVDGSLIASRAPDTKTPGFYVIAFSPDEKTLAVGSALGAIEVLDAEQLTTRTVLTGHRKKNILRLAYSADGRLLASAGRDYQTIVQDLSRPVEVARFETRREATQTLTFSDDRKTLFGITNAGLARRWNVATGDREYETSVADPLLCAAFTHTNEMFFVGSNHGALRLGNRRDGRVHARIETGLAGLLTIAVDRVGHRVAVGDQLGRVAILERHRPNRGDVDRSAAKSNK